MSTPLTLDWAKELNSQDISEEHLLIHSTNVMVAMDNKALADIPVVAMTANVFKEGEEATESAGMQARIAKPLDIEKMLKTLSKVLSKKQG